MSRACVGHRQAHNEARLSSRVPTVRTQALRHVPAWCARLLGTALCMKRPSDAIQHFRRDFDLVPEDQPTQGAISHDAPSHSGTSDRYRWNNGPLDAGHRDCGGRLGYSALLSSNAWPRDAVVVGRATSRSEMGSLSGNSPREMPPTARYEMSVQRRAGRRGNI
jgi:hypothetical protein